MRCKCAPRMLNSKWKLLSKKSSIHVFYLYFNSNLLEFYPDTTSLISYTHLYPKRSPSNSRDWKFDYSNNWGKWNTRLLEYFVKLICPIHSKGWNARMITKFLEFDHSYILKKNLNSNAYFPSSPRYQPQNFLWNSVRYFWSIFQ